MSFKNEFLKMQPGPAREALVYNALIAQGPPKNLVPVTVPGPNGTQITYKTMPDYVSIDGLRVTLTPSTAQRLANAWGMSLPTAKMSQQIYNAADTKVRAPPLSGSGYTGIDGKKYTAKDVAETRIGASDAAVRYNDLTNKEVAKAGENPGLISGHGKEILEPVSNPNDVSFGGWQGSNGKPLQPYGSAHHGESENHTEYALYTRLIGGDVVITTPDGKKITTTMEKLRANPNMSSAVANSPGIKQYNAGKQPATKQKDVPMSAQPEKEQVAYSPPKAQSGRLSFLERIDDFLNQFKGISLFMPVGYSTLGSIIFRNFYRNFIAN